MRRFNRDDLVSLTYCRSTGYREFNIRDMSPVKFLAFVWYINLSRDILEMIYELRSYPSNSKLYGFFKRKSRGRGQEVKDKSEDIQEQVQMKYVSEELIQVRNIFMNRLEFFFPKETLHILSLLFLEFYIMGKK